MLNSYPPETSTTVDSWVVRRASLWWPDQDPPATTIEDSGHLYAYDDAVSDYKLKLATDALTRSGLPDDLDALAGYSVVATTKHDSHFGMTVRNVQDRATQWTVLKADA